MRPEDELSRKFEELRFPDEPPMPSQPNDDLERGTRLLRRRRAMALVPGLAAVTVAATGVALALPLGPGSGQPIQVAGNGSGHQSAPQTPNVDETREPTKPVVPDDGYEFPATRQLLFDAAAEHLDPKGKHLPRKSSNVQTSGGMGDGVNVGTKLEWTVPGEDGMGMVPVFVTTPGGGIEDPYSCWDDESRCTEVPIPGTSETAWVAEPDPELGLRLGVYYERPDGSVVGIGVYDLFGNNTTTPVSNVDIDLKDAFAFVTDPDIRVDPSEAETFDPTFPPGPEGSKRAPAR